MNFAHPLSAATLVSAAVKVVLPWSMCPMVPTLTCGLLRSNFSLAMSSTSSYSLASLGSAFRLRSLHELRRTGRPRNFQPACLAVARLRAHSMGARFGVAKAGADVQDRTGDLVLTKDALCQLSYIGLRASRY